MTPGAGSAVLETIAWYCGNSDDTIHPVAGLDPNPWGLYDMLGNAWEWVYDWNSEYPTDPVIDPSGPAGGRSKVTRGGSSYFNARNVRAAHREGTQPAERNTALGFRPVRSLEP